MRVASVASCIVSAGGRSWRMQSTKWIVSRRNASSKRSQNVGVVSVRMPWTSAISTWFRRPSRPMTSRPLVPTTSVAA